MNASLATELAQSLVAHSGMSECVASSSARWAKHGLTAAGLVAQAGRKTLLIERNHDVGGAASTYTAGGLVVEASLHETSDPREPI